MLDERPRPELPMRPFDWLLELLGWATLAWLLASFWSVWPGLPDTVAVHFDVAGRPDRYGDKNILWLLPAVGTLCFALLWVVARVPHLHNYVIPIHDGNAAWAYRISARGVRALNVTVTLLFALLVRYSARASVTESLPPAWFIWLPVALTLLVPAAMIWAMLRGRSRYEPPTSL